MINNGTKNQIFAGYYTDEVASLTVKKGHIVTKTFKLLLENTKATKLELVARLVGDRNLPAYKSSAAGNAITDNGFGVMVNDSGTANIDTKVASDNYYTSEGKYDLAPIQYQNITETPASRTHRMFATRPPDVKPSVMKIKPHGHAPVTLQHRRHLGTNKIKQDEQKQIITR